MKPISLPLLLLGSLLSCKTALAATEVNNSPSTITKREDGEGGLISVLPTYHPIDDYNLGHAINCLANWCDEDHFVRKAGGMVRCRSPGDYGAEVFICNIGEVQRCSSRQLSKAINELRAAGSTTGAVVHDLAKDRGLKFGFDYFCKEGHEYCPTKEAAYDATRKHCTGKTFYETKIQHEIVADPTRGVGKLTFTGWDWVKAPEERPEEYSYGFVEHYDPEDYEDWGVPLEEDYVEAEADRAGP